MLTVTNKNMSIDRVAAVPTIIANKVSMLTCQKYMARNAMPPKINHRATRIRIALIGSHSHR
jgi:hypothetical protein